MTSRSTTVIAGGKVLDGLGGAAQDCDVYIRDARIDDLRPHSDSHRGYDVIDAAGLTITPGFIDTHSHADNAPFVHENDTMKILQGVTTEVVGNCGFSLAPVSSEWREEHQNMVSAWPHSFAGSSFAELLAETDKLGYMSNYVPLVGHGAIRLAAMGMDNREPTRQEQIRMEVLLEAALDAGAFGMSTGLVYPPGVFSKTDEIVNLAKRLRSHSIYASHIRGEGSTLLEAVAEALQIGESSARRLVLSHHKATGKQNWGATERSLQLIQDARDRGVDVYQDMYPYTAGSTFLSALIPPEFHEGGKKMLLSRLTDRSELQRIQKRLDESPTSGFQNTLFESGYESVLISLTNSRKFEGQTLVEAARSLGRSNFDTLIHILVTEDLSPQMIVFFIDENDIERVMRNKRTAFGSDGAFPGTVGKSHPRTFGTFPRVLSRYVRDKAVLTLEEGVRKMTSLPAEMFHLGEVGQIAPSKLADLVAFDAATISDDLDYQDPVRLPKGIAWVMQSGQVVVKDNQFLGARRGRRFEPK
jgi:dihydroorotase/N-acyl-D-amino-acid deacylase